MKEIEKRELITPYWDCGRGDCKVHHRTEEAAVKCREAGRTIVSTRIKYKKQVEKYIMCANRKAKGETYVSIAKELGSSPTYVRYMGRKGMKILEKRARVKETP